MFLVNWEKKTVSKLESNENNRGDFDPFLFLGNYFVLQYDRTKDFKINSIINNSTKTVYGVYLEPFGP